MGQDMTKMEEKLLDLKSNLEQYKVESAKSVRKFNTTKQKAEKEVWERTREERRGEKRRNIINLERSYIVNIKKTKEKK